MPDMSATRLETVAEAAREAGLDGWLFYDFRGQNPIAATVLGLPDGHLTRRWFLYVPATGTPTLVHSRIEAGTWNAMLSGERLNRVPYSAHTELDERLRAALAGARRVAMEYQPRGAVPFVSRVDAGTVERVRETGVEVVSSENLLARFITWDPEDLRAHERAVLGAIRAKDEAFLFIHNRLRDGEPVTELMVQDVVSRVLHEQGLEFDHPAIVGFAGHAGDPHHAPDPRTDRTLRMGECVLIDLWGAVPGRPYADITWMGHAGAPTPEFMRAWAAVRDGRDAALAALRERYRPAEGRFPQGWEIDRVTRDLIDSRGYAAAYVHRTGHHLGTQATHGPGVNLDDFETRDSRLVLPGLAVTVEPGVYLPDLGVRSEVDVYLGEDGPVVTTPIQEGPYVLGLEYFHEHLERAHDAG
jgi:Xaa-Pro aminopeptidase